MATHRYREVADGQTRLCTDPWDTPYVNADGTVKPCCWIHESFGDTSTAKLEELLDNEAYQALRRGLLSGNLRRECACCVDRPVGTKDELTAAVSSGRDVESSLPSLLKRSDTIRTLMITVTEDCNLRCVYCLVSGPTYEAKIASRELLVRLAADLADLQVHDIVLNGHGETTYYEGWQEVLRAYRSLPSRLSLTSNLSMHFSDDDLDVLALLDRVIVSVDSIDRATQLKLRKGSDIRTLTFNLVRLLTRWTDRDRRKSAIIQTVLSRQAVEGYPKLVEFFLRVGVREFWLCNLVEYEHAKDNVQHVASISDPVEFRSAMLALSAACTAVAKFAGFVTAQAGLLDAIEERAHTLECDLRVFRKGDHLYKVVVGDREEISAALGQDIQNQSEWLTSASRSGKLVELEGHLDSIGADGSLMGWARCANDPFRRLIVEAVLNGTVLAVGRADLPRGDLVDNGDGLCGYRLETHLPKDLIEGRNLRYPGIFVRVAGA